VKKAKTPKKKSSAGAPDRARPASSSSASPRDSWLVVAALISALIIAVASFFPAQRLWGINHLAFVPPVARWVALGVLVLGFVPLVAQPVYRAALGLFDRLGTLRGASRLALVGVIALGSIAAFWSFRSSTLLLGDGQLLVRSFEAAEEGYDKVIMRSAKAIMNEEKIAPGTTLFYYGAVQVGEKYKKPPLDSMRALNCVLGGMLIFLLGTVVTGGFARGEIRLWLLLLALGSCTLELFFGYIENCTTPTLLLAIYVVLSFRAIHARGSTWWPAVPLLLACYAHIQSILFLPSYLYVILWSKSPAQRGDLLRRWTVTFSTVAFAGVIAAPLLVKMRKFYVPLGFSNEKYAVLSPHHLADIVNELFILVPILPVVAMMAWLGRRLQKASGRDPLRDPQATKTPTEWFSHPAEWQFTTTILVPCGLYILFFHPAIGMARDWDLFTMSTTAMVPFVLLVLNRYLRLTGLGTDAVARFAVPSLVVLMVTSAAWVSVNASTARTIDRFKSILTYDRTHASYAWENLAVLQHDSKQLDDAIATMRIAVDHSHNPRQQVRLAVYLDESGKTDEAIEIVEQILERRPEFDKARFRLLVFLEKQDRWNDILEVSREGVKYSPKDGIYQFFYGEALIRVGRVEEGIALFRECARFDLPVSVKDHIAATLQAYERQKQQQQQK